MYCNQCGNNIIGDEKICRNCGAEVYPKYERKKRKSKINFKAICLVLAVVIAATVFGYIKLSNPMTGVAAAAKKTLSANSAAFEIITDYRTTKGEIELDKDDRCFGIHSESERNGMQLGDESWVRYNKTDRKVYYKNYKGKLIEDEITEEGIAFIEAIFDYVNGKADEETIRTFLEEQGLDESIRIDNLEEEGGKFVKKLLKKDNLEDILGYTKTKENGETVYGFNIDLVKFAEFLLNNGRALFTSEGWREMEEFSEDIIGEANIMEVKLIAKQGYLVGIEIKAEAETISIRLYDINKIKITYPTE